MFTTEVKIGQIGPVWTTMPSDANVKKVIILVQFTQDCWICWCKTHVTFRTV